MKAMTIRHLTGRAAADPAGAVRMMLRRVTLASDLRRRDGRSSPPRVVALKLTDRCNLRCAMCDQFGPTGRPAEANKKSPSMPIEAIDRLLRQVSAFKPTIYLTGGEPMLHPEILTIIEIVTRSYGLACEMNTNGLLVGHHAGELGKRCGLSILTVSVHGPDAESNDAVVRVKGAHDRTVASIQAVRQVRKSAGKRRPLIRINCVLTKRTHDRLAEMVEFAEGVGADQLNFQHPIHTTPEILSRHRAEFEPLFGTYSPGLSGYLNGADGLDFHSLGSQLEIVGERSRRLRVTVYPIVAPEEIAAYYDDTSHRFRREGCSAPWIRAAIQPNGDVSPCLDLTVGNAFAEGFEAVWNGDRYRKFRRALAARALFPGCARCCHRFYR